MEVENNVKVKSLVIQLADATITLSIDEARVLYHQLHDLFGQANPSVPIVIERTRWPYWWPNTAPNAPYVTPSSPPELPKIWCSAAEGPH